ncbi:hypothetical protein FIBSPDRAFT_842845 [Athelia psychrophila]|uniref:Aminoglycoside phosphotransferase domain-containing protein n=1 Tax=Athelia psychrophila TaxID=1759441 RepID=A0A167W288_9AGAM|nr:hypothetical protein FIBSPDRAFT_842845 [Fibularhizoctonia sp. CBS 109695]
MEADGEKRYGVIDYGARSQRLLFGLYGKTGCGIRRAEAEVMVYLKKRTTIPIPTVLDIIDVPNGVFILMTRLPGRQLGGLPYSEMTEQQRDTLAVDLKASFDQLRALRQPAHLEDRICNFSGGEFTDYRVHSSDSAAYATPAEFYDHMFQHIEIKQHERLRALAKDVHTTAYPLVLTHCDLHTKNVLADENYRLTGIVDWECCAWLPAYWEYTRTQFGKERYHEWIEIVNKMLSPWPKELELEKEIWGYTWNI